MKADMVHVYSNYVTLREHTLTYNQIVREVLLTLVPNKLPSNSSGAN